MEDALADAEEAELPNLPEPELDEVSEGEGEGGGGCHEVPEPEVWAARLRKDFLRASCPAHGRLGQDVWVREDC